MSCKKKAELLRDEYQKKIDDVLERNGIERMTIILRNAECEPLAPLGLQTAIGSYHVTPWTNYVFTDDILKNASESDRERLSALEEEGFYESIDEHDEEYLSNIYEDLNELTAKYGFFFVAYRSFRLTDAKVKSKYGSYDEYYAPEIIEMDSYSDDLFARDAKRLASSLKKISSGTIWRQMKITIVWKDKKLAKSLHDTYLIVYNIIQIVNLYGVELYRLQKNNKEYQHRKDWNPDDF